MPTIPCCTYCAQFARERGYYKNGQYEDVWNVYGFKSENCDRSQRKLRLNPHVCKMCTHNRWQMSDIPNICTKCADWCRTDPERCVKCLDTTFSFCLDAEGVCHSCNKCQHCGR